MVIYNKSQPSPAQLNENDTLILEKLEALGSEIKALREDLNQIRAGMAFEKRADSPVGPPKETIPGEQVLNPLSPSEKLIADWLQTRQITLLKFHQTDPTDKYLDKLAELLGSNYARLSRVHSMIKTRYYQQDFSYPLVLEPAEAENARDYLELLKVYAFITQNRQPNGKLYVKPQNLDQAKRFFNNGFWFERFIRMEFSKALIQNKTNFSSLANLQIKLPDTQNAELDLLFLVEGQPWWIECKAGESGSENLARYLSLRKQLRVPPEMAFLVFLDKEEAELEAQTTLHNFTCVNAAGFLEKTRRQFPLLKIEPANQVEPAAKPGIPGAKVTLIQEITKPSPSGAGNKVVNQKPITQEKTSKSMETGTPSSVARSVSTLPATAELSEEEMQKQFVGSQLDPLPEHRQSLLKELINLFSTQEVSLTADQLKKELVERNPGLKKKRISHFLTPLYLAGGLLDGSNKPLKQSDKTPIVKLKERDPVNLEEIFVHEYVKIILKGHPNCFSQEKNRVVFKALVKPLLSPSQVKKILDAAAEPVIPGVSSLRQPPAKISEVLAGAEVPLPVAEGKGLPFYPDPETREKLIKLLVEYISEANYLPRLQSGIRAEIALRSGLSGKPVHSILFHLFKGKALLDGEGQPVTAYAQPVCRLVSNNLKDLEEIVETNFIASQKSTLETPD